MANYYLAIDLGASGGRHILGHVEQGKLCLEEVHRFDNAPVRQGNSLVWDEERIFGEITQGIVKCGRLNKLPRSVGIDTWGVDYALLDKQGRLIGPVHAYRDGRTGPFTDTKIPFEELYGVTGIAFQPFNTVYQLLADKAAGRLEQADHLLMLPEYFSARLTGNLTGKTTSEYTMASTTGLLDARQKTWAEGIIQGLGLPKNLFKPVREPPYGIGEFSEALQREAGFNAQVVMIACHDTASAVATVDDDALYISSGTWSLLGVRGAPILDRAAREAGYTNEGSHDGRIRFLKNIMGLWVLQQFRHELNDAYSFAELEEAARQTEAANAVGTGIRGMSGQWCIDINLPQFLNPPSMIKAIQAEYERTCQKIPQSPGELAFCIYSSLAQSYKIAIADLEKITGKTYPSLSIIGGGSKDGYLNALTAVYTGKPVYAGPAEATAAGNILLQMKQAGESAVSGGFSGLVKNSFDIREH